MPVLPPVSSRPHSCQDDLTKLNERTARNLTLTLRFTRVESKNVTRDGKKAFSIVTAVLLDHLGNYCGWQRMAFGSPAERKAIVDETMQKYHAGSLWTFSQIKAVSEAKLRFGFFQHPIVIEYGNKKQQFQAVRVPEEDPLQEWFPRVCEAKIRLHHLNAINRGRLLDVVALVKHSGELRLNAKGSVFEVTLTDKDEDTDPVELTLACWCKDQKSNFDNHVGSVVYLYNVWAKPSELSDKIKGLSTVETTNIVFPPTDMRGKHAEYLLSNAKDILGAAADCISENFVPSNGADDTDYSTLEAVASSAHFLQLTSQYTNKFSSEPSQTFDLLQLNVSTVTLSPKAEGCTTKDDTRLWVEANIEDLSGTLVAKMGEKVALEMSHQESKDSFLEAFENGTLAFSRGCLRVKRDVVKITNKESAESRQVVNTTVVACLPQSTGKVVDIPFPLNGNPTLPCSISSLRVSPFGEMVISISSSRGESQHPVKAALCLLRGAKSPKQKHATVLSQLSTRDAQTLGIAAAMPL